jgi:hypothetical protein
MSIRKGLVAVVATVAVSIVALVGCGSDTGSAGSTGSSQSFECCLNGSYYDCPSEAAVNACFDKSDSSGCTFTKSDPSGNCN